MFDIIFVLAGIGTIGGLVVMVVFGARSQKSLLKANKFIIRIKYDPVGENYEGGGYAYNMWGRMFGTLMALNQIYNTSCCHKTVNEAETATANKLGRLIGDYKKPTLYYVERSKLLTNVRR